MGASERHDREEADREAEPHAPDFVGIEIKATDGPNGWELDGPWKWMGRLWRLIGGTSDGR